MRARNKIRLGVERLETRDTPTVIWELGGGRAAVSLQATDAGIYQLVTPGHVSVVQPGDPRLPGLLRAAGISPADVPGFTTTTVTASVASSTYGQSVFFTATVLPTAPLTGSPEGTVQFFVDGNSFGSPVTLGGGTATSAPLSTLSAGTHLVKAVYTNTGGSFFNSTSADFTATVNKATLTVTADDASRVYGAPNPSFTATITGFQNGETLASSGVVGASALSTTATASSPVGAYPITAGPGTLAANNYAFTFVNGTLTVAAAGVVDGNLVVAGTNGTDTITINTSNAAAVSVLINATPVPGSPFDLSPYPAGRVLVYGLDGGDVIQTSGPRPAEVHGGAGQDFLFGGSGNDVLSGEDENDFLSGGGGNDVLVGDAGKDNLSGGAGMDVLIGGSVSPTFTYADVDAVRNDWVLNGDEASALINALAAATTDPNTTDDVDTLSGGGDSDLFLWRDSGVGVDLVTDFTGADKARTIV